MKCDKCGNEVNPKNDVVNLEYILEGSSLILLIAQSRHVLPVYDAARNIICKDSPSRAQYIMEVNHDARPQYKYKEELAPKYQEAWKRLQKEF